MLQLVQEISGLSAEDHRLIEDEHARLERFLHDLRDTCKEFCTQNDCQGCERERIASCRGRLTSFFYDFLDLVAEHFENEEKIMRGSLLAMEDSPYYRQHQEEHASLMREMRTLMQESAALSEQGNTAQAIRQLYSRVTARFGEHARLYDTPFLRAAQSVAAHNVAG